MTDWEEVLNRHGSVVWQTAWRMLGNHADALDCYQTVFLEALRVVERDTVHDWPALLKRLATARALDLLRARYRQAGRHEPLASPTAVVSRRAEPEHDAEASELLERLRVELAELPNQQAEVFSLVVLEGMTYRQVGDRLKLSTSAVGMVLNRARKRLRERLAWVEPEAKRKY